MKEICMQLAVWFTNVIYMPFRLFKKQNRVVFLSRQSNEPTLDIVLLSKELERKNIEYVILSKKLEKSITSAIAYVFHMLMQMFYIATSRVIVLDGYCILASVLPKNKSKTIIQTWHSLGAIKKFGWQTIGKQWGSNESVAKIMKLHMNYDFAIAPSAITADHFSEAFCIDRDKMVALGLPRIDYLVKEDMQMKTNIEAVYNQIGDKINVLYAPTFRKNASVEISSVVENFDFDKFNLILKKHFLDKSDYSWVEKKGVIVDDKFSSMEWMKICEKIITDYSAISLEAAILERDIYIYMPDDNDYQDKVGTNISLKEEAIGHYVYNDGIALCKSLQEQYDKKSVIEYKKKYIEVECGCCTVKLADFISEFL